MKTMKIFRSMFLGAAMLVASACEEGIDPISRVAPGPDEVAPTILIKNPATEKILIPVSETQKDVVFEFEVTDDIELANITVSLNGSQVETHDEFKDYRRVVHSFTQNSLPVGYHSLEIKATDLTGKSATKVFEFEVSNDYVAREGEIFYMPFEDDKLLDLVSEQTGTPSGAVAFTDGVKGKAASFDGASQSYFLFPGEALAALQSFTISFWVKPIFIDADDSDGIDGILGLVNLSNTGTFWGNIDLFVENNSNPEGAIIKSHILNGNGDETWIDNITGVENFFGAWSHHAMVFDGAAGQFEYYINGVSVSTKAAAWGTDPLTFSNSGPMVFGTVHFQTDPSLTTGSGAQSWASYLTGEMDEIKIFNRPLPAAEVTAIYDEDK